VLGSGAGLGTGYLQRAKQYIYDRPDLLILGLVLLVVLGTPVTMVLFSRLVCLLAGEMC
jgi:hypothetical protein